MDPEMNDNQTSRILRRLQSGRTITPLEALRDFGCFRLGARIWDLRQLGYDITKTLTESDDGRKRWAKYRLTTARR